VTLVVWWLGLHLLKRT